jgi:hypothetical protein
MSAMPSVEKRQRGGSVSWRAHYRDPAGRQHSKSFARKVDAERFLTTVEASKLTGSYVEAAAGRVTVGVWADRWLAGQSHLKPSSRARYEGVLAKHPDVGVLRA